MRIRNLVIGAVLVLLLGLTALVGLAQEPSLGEGQHQQATAVLFENVRIFDGTSEQLSEPSQVLVVGNQIETIDTQSFPIPNSNLTRIDGAGQVLMPGLIDAHTHLFMETLSSEELLEAATVSPGVLFQRAEENATAMLMRGFTSVRDMAGPVFRLKRSIDQGEVVGRHDHGGSQAVQLQKKAHDLLAHHGVDVAGGLVGEDQVGAGDEGAGEGDTLLLSARENGGLGVDAVAEPDPV